MKVLVVVEDDPDMQLLIGITLASDDRLEVSGQATTALEAVRVAREERPDLVVLDHFIDGDIMGLEAAPMIKKASPNSSLLLFTSHDLQAEASREACIDEYLRKTDIRELLVTVQRMLGLSQAA